MACGRGVEVPLNVGVFGADLEIAFEKLYLEVS
jgi:hypothetical protein